MPRGLLTTYSDKRDWREIEDGLGHAETFNTYKPLACGVVIHPAIEVAQLRDTHGLRGTDIERIDPRVSARTGTDWQDSAAHGLEGKFSVCRRLCGRHRVRLRGEAEFSDEGSDATIWRALRSRVRAAVDATMAEDAADVTITLADGRTLHMFVAHAVGSLERPLDDAALAQVPRPGRRGARRRTRCTPARSRLGSATGGRLCAFAARAA